MPVYGILCDGAELAFEFFRFDGSTKPSSFCRGRDTLLRTRLHLPEFTHAAHSRGFIDALRPICEIIFDLLLNGYISSLEADYKCSGQDTATAGKLGPSPEKWTPAISSAQKALTMFRDAETKRGAQLIDEANTTVEQAMETLKSRYGSFNV